MIIPGQVLQRVARAQAIGNDRGGDAGPRDDELAECTTWVDLDLARLARPREEALGETFGACSTRSSEASSSERISIWPAREALTSFP